ncbi:MAG: hypothetical protein GYB49_10575 [Alphaproteobacteria bacterium]|nr:hypothetical protein [Hyphomonas sp.]MBR9807653.1 hypothetical protein [Alphaproteobacteria bacterium]
MDDGELDDLPDEEVWRKVARGALQIGSAIPFAGGMFSAAAGAWSEHAQDEINKFLHAYMAMMREKLREQDRTFAEIVERIDTQDKKTEERINSPEYQALIRKAFRNWAGAESERKRVLVRNILSNASSTDLASYDVLNLFLDWLHKYSELHFAVMADIANNAGSTRGEIWARLGKGDVREDSADADLFKLLFLDLSTGHVIRQHRETNAAGEFVRAQRKNAVRGGSKTYTSAFDDEKRYELTALGRQFVHYAMTEVPVKISYKEASDNDD